MTLLVDGWIGGASFSTCGTYRYALSREWQDGSGTVLFVMLNPSTASHEVNDPTIRRCMGFARLWDAKRLEIRNLFAYRATDPKDMVTANERGVDIIGAENDERIESAHEAASKTIVAWGAHPLAQHRGRDVWRRLLVGKSSFCLGSSKSGAPRHPLYVPSLFAPVEYRP